MIRSLKEAAQSVRLRPVLRPYKRDVTTKRWTTRCKNSLHIQSGRIPALVPPPPPPPLPPFQQRLLHLTPAPMHGEFEREDPASPDEVYPLEWRPVFHKVNVAYIDRDGSRHEIKGKVGDNALYLAHRYGIEMEGACEASLACTTCHVYVEGGHFDTLPEATEEEEDLLDLAPFLADNSRLGCQIILTKELDGLVLRLPRATRNFYVDGHTPQAH